MPRFLVSVLQSQFVWAPAASSQGQLCTVASYPSGRCRMQKGRFRASLRQAISRLGRHRSSLATRLQLGHEKS
eukprot:3534070-Pleurochrysis_carterae.AAC.2